MRVFRGMMLILALVAVVALLYAVLDRFELLDEAGESIPDAIPAEADRATMDWVYDGDTIEVVIDGGSETVRLTGINAPETGGNNTAVECFGSEATQFLRSLLPEGSTVWLERDQSERDRYGRLVRFVWIVDGDGLVVLTNNEVVRKGFADARVYRPDDGYAGLLAASEELAREQELGMWGGCG